MKTVEKNIYKILVINKENAQQNNTNFDCILITVKRSHLKYLSDLFLKTSNMNVFILF